MTALAADIQRIFQSGRDLAPISIQVLASTTIYDGSAVMALAASHYARPVASGATGPQFLGFAVESVVAGATQATTPTVLVRQQGKIQVPNIVTTWWALAAIVTGDIGKIVYLTDDGTGFTITAGTAVGIGKIDNIDLVNGFVTVAFQSFAMRSV